jgi:hypothetical protein
MLSFGGRDTLRMLSRYIFPARWLRVLGGHITLRSLIPSVMNWSCWSWQQRGHSPSENWGPVFDPILSVISCVEEASICFPPPTRFREATETQAGIWIQLCRWRKQLYITTTEAQSRFHCGVLTSAYVVLLVRRHMWGGSTLKTGLTAGLCTLNGIWWSGASELLMWLFPYL